MRGSSDAFDVAVVGAGPAGAAAALDLARAGARVVVLERDALPRYKTCGGGVVRRAAAFLPADVDPTYERVFHAVEMHLVDADLHFEVRRDAPILNASMRADFDASLVRAAQRRGAEVRAPCRVSGVAQDAATVALETTDGPVLARFVIAADGADSHVAARAGWGPIAQRAPALEWEVEVGPESWQRHGSALRFDFGSVPGGYAWVFPKRDHLSVGVVRVRRDAASLPALLGAYLASIGVRDIRRIDRHGAWVPLRPRPGGACRGRVLLAGDAAGVADPLLCEGIRFAIRSGRLAAAAVVDAGFEARRVGAAYEAALRAEVYPELLWARRLAAVLYGSERLRAALFRSAGPRLCEAMVDVVTGRTSYGELLHSRGDFLRRLRGAISGAGPHRGRVPEM